MRLPQYIDRRDAALALNVHPRTISRLLEIPHKISTERIKLKKLATALKADVHWLAQCLSGEDQAVTLQQAMQHLGYNKMRRLTSIDCVGKLTLAARFGNKGLRFSARKLGMFDPARLWTVGHPEYVANILEARRELKAADRVYAAGETS